MSRMRLLIVSGRTLKELRWHLRQGEALVKDGGQEPACHGEDGVTAMPGRRPRFVQAVLRCWVGRPDDDRAIANDGAPRDSSSYLIIPSTLVATD